MTARTGTNIGGTRLPPPFACPVLFRVGPILGSNLAPHPEQTLNRTRNLSTIAIKLWKNSPDSRIKRLQDSTHANSCASIHSTPQHGAGENPKRAAGEHIASGSILDQRAQSQRWQKRCRSERARKQKHAMYRKTVMIEPECGSLKDLTGAQSETGKSRRKGQRGNIRTKAKVRWRLGKQDLNVSQGTRGS